MTNMAFGDSPIRFYFPDFIQLSCLHYRFPFARLCVLHNIWQFFAEVAPPLLQAVTWSASMSFILQIVSLLASCPIAQCEQFDSPFLSALVVCSLYDDFLVASSKTLTSSNFVSVEPPKINSKKPLRFLTYRSPYSFCTSSQTFFGL